MNVLDIGSLFFFDLDHDNDDILSSQRAKDLVMLGLTLATEMCPQRFDEGRCDSFFVYLYGSSYSMHIRIVSYFFFVSY